MSSGGQVAVDVRAELLRLRQENERWKASYAAMADRVAMLSNQTEVVQLRRQLADTRAALRVTCEVIRGHRECVICRARRSYGVED